MNLHLTSTGGIAVYSDRSGYQYLCGAVVASTPQLHFSFLLKPICLTDTGPYARMRHGDHALAETGPDNESMSQ